MRKKRILKKETKRIIKNRNLSESKPLDHYRIIYKQIIKEISEIINNNDKKIS